MADIGTDVAAYLAAQGYGIWKNANSSLNTIFLDEFQDLPDNQIVLFTGGGLEPDEVQGSAAAVDYPSLDVQVRNSSKATARTKAEEIRVLLDCITINDATLYNASSAPVYLGRDDTNRHRFVVMFTVVKERV
ncbi:MAG: minor capsid protein [Bacilli bacterium]|jgi:hypothetical protein